jgi:acetolactate decarboxylase
MSRSARIFAMLLCCSVLFLSSADPAGSRAPFIPVYDRGSMKEIYQDDAAAKVSLSDLKDTEHLYALGPLSKLRGEILIWDSKPYEVRVKDGQMQVKSDWDESAAFLVWASVKKWQKTRVPASVRSLDTLEKWMYSMSGKPGSPLSSQYPFLIKGKFGRIAWHVINVRDDGKGLTPEKVEAQRYHGESKFLHADMVGFYSPAHQGLFIPQGRRTHLHLRAGEDMVAHVDDFDPLGDEGLILYVPGR